MKLFFACLIFLASHAAYARTYKVGLRSLPTTIDVRKNQLNTDLLILLHLYFPMFHFDETGQLNSHFFEISETKALSKNFDSFQFCLKPESRFADDSPLAVHDVQTSLAEIHATQETLEKIGSMTTINDRCLGVKLTRSDSKYFEKLMGISSTVIKSSTKKEPIPVGLGPYRVVSASQEMLKLQKSSLVKGDISELEFLKVTTIEEALSKRIDDWNHIYRISGFEKYLKGYQRVQSSFMKVYSIVTNIEDASLRKLIASCFPRTTFTLAFNPALKKTKGFLPNGLSGSNVDFDAIFKDKAKCQFPKDQRFVFSSESTDEMRRMQEYKNSPQGRFLKEHFENVLLSGADLVNLVFSRKPYIAIIGFDSSGSQDADAGETSVFFESFIREERLISKHIRGLKQAVVEAAKSKRADDKDRLYGKAHKLLLESGYVIPLGQVDSTQYYSPDIENIVWADKISGFPKYYEMKVRK